MIMIFIMLSIKYDNETDSDIQNQKYYWNKQPGRLQDKTIVARPTGVVQCQEGLPPKTRFLGALQFYLNTLRDKSVFHFHTLRVWK